MKIVCAWCKKNMGDKPPLKDMSTSHGMCEECFEKEVEKLAAVIAAGPSFLDDNWQETEV